MDRAGLRRDLHALIAECAPDLIGDLPDDSPLITSGVVESAALLSVALWVEGQLGGEIDITSFDLVAEWDSIGGILDFVERHAPAAAGAARRGS
jgi:acyl carrier protein